MDGVIDSERIYLLGRGRRSKRTYVLDPAALLGCGVVSTRAIRIENSSSQLAVQFGKIWIVREDFIVDWGEHFFPFWRDAGLF